MQIDIEFHERIGGIQIAMVKVGNTMVVMEQKDWLEFAHGVIREIETHLTKRAADGACCSSCGSKLVNGVCVFHGCPVVTPRR